jgi:hypothetical protein
MMSCAPPASSSSGSSAGDAAPIAFNRRIYASSSVIGVISVVQCIRHSTRGVLLLVRFSKGGDAVLTLHDSSKPLHADVSGDSFIATYAPEATWRPNAASDSVKTCSHTQCFVTSGERFGAFHGDEIDARHVFLCGSRTLRKHDLMTGALLASSDGGGLNLLHMCLSCDERVLCAMGTEPRERAPSVILVYDAVELRLLRRFATPVGSQSVAYPRFVGTGSDAPPKLHIFCERQEDSRNPPPSGALSSPRSLFCLLELDLSSSDEQEAVVVELPLQEAEQQDEGDDTSSLLLALPGRYVSALTVTRTQRTAACVLSVRGGGGDSERVCVFTDAAGSRSGSSSFNVSAYSLSTQRIEQPCAVVNDFAAIVAVRMNPLLTMATHLAVVPLALRRETFTLPLAAADKDQTSTYRKYTCMHHFSAKGVAVLYYNASGENWIDVYDVNL